VEVFVRHIVNGKTSRINNASHGGDAEGPSTYAVVDADGRFVVFQSDATNIVAGDFNRHTDISAYDRATGLTLLELVAFDATPTNGVSRYLSVSRHGRFVAFQSGPPTRRLMAAARCPSCPTMRVS
jgi:hypothetical protein